MSDFSERRVKLLHQISIITVGIAIFCGILSIYLEITELIYFHFLTAFIYLFCVYLTKKGLLKIPRLIYFITLNIAITVTASFIGQDGAVEFMLMFALALPFLSFSSAREKWYIIIFSFFSISLWILLYITKFNLITTFKVDPEVAANLIYPISIICTLSLVTFQLVYFSFQNSLQSSSVHINREEAVEASNAKSKFLSTMSHEIRTPLNAVIGLSHILSDNNPRKNQIENINALNYSGKILLNLLNNVLDFSKMQSTEIELDAIPTDLLLAVKQIKKIHEISCFRKGIVMNLEIDNTIPIVILDIVRFNQVINNLVTNAIKFTDKGSVTLKISKKNETTDSINIVTEIVDTGIGIPLDKQDTIWEAFTQASSTTNRLYGGTGLGLPIVKSIVEAMDSKVLIESEIGKGSRFYFEMHLKKALDGELQNLIETKQHNFKGEKVLLVEDNLINVMVGKQILEKAKLTVAVANNGLIAVNMVKENDYDIVLMDIQMPVMDGYTATKEIRKFNKKIPVLALSASVFMEVRDKINECGMNGFIFKPFDHQDLLNQIEQAINS
ncbi:response regulator [Polaribacter litorisediminis]|uniref:response regulator n=1 Tax=Polaribacter litorisediminis TaxID=1908341 RepID=UPI001CBF3ABE|nr:response regulator [Polaribacter litorisediminis]UAM99830.1 response regulator [Polaribacter litorisediminis]